jgi:hypothetical protein
VRLRSYYWCCYHGGSAGRHTDLEDVRLRSYNWCGSGAAQLLLVRLRRCYAALIGAATQLLSVLLRSSYRRCYAALIGAATQLHQRCYAAPPALLRSSISAATQLLSALLRSSYRRCYHGRISRGGSEKGKGCGLGARAARSTRRKTQKNANEMCLCFQSSRL